MLTDAQLEQRKHGIGASEIGAVCGINPWRGPIDVWLDKTEGPRPLPSDAQHRCDWGTTLEPVIADWYSARHKVELHMSGTLVGPEPWILATPDRLVYDTNGLPSSGIEIKVVGSRVASHWTEAHPADYVIAQCQWGLLVTGLDRWDIVASIAGAPPVSYEVLRDAEMIDMMIARGRALWKHVQDRTPPEPDGTDSYRRYLARRYPDSSGSTRELPFAGRYVRDFQRAQTDVRAAKWREDAAKNKLRELIGPDEAICGTWGRVTNRPTKKGNRTLRVTSYE